MKFKPNDFRKIVIGSFLAVPALSSLISTIHIVEFFGLGNQTWMAIILALAFEIGSIASLMTLAVLDKINRFAVWFIFIVLLAMQMLGNVYYTYDFISGSMASNATWIQSFVDLVEMMTMQKLEPRSTKFILSLLIGLPIPIISLAFLKSVSDYLKPENKESNKENVKSESKGETLSISNDNHIDTKEEYFMKSIPIEAEPVEESVIEQIEEPISEIVAEPVEEQTEEQVSELIEENVPEIIENSEIETKENEIKVKTEQEELNIYDEDESSVSEQFFNDETQSEEYDGFFSEEEREDDEKKN